MPPEHSRIMTGPRERTSAGGVVVRTGAGVEVCLIRPTGRTVWGLPKGGIESGETLTQAAVREVAEETGVSGVVAGELGAIDYSFYSREQCHRRRHGRPRPRGQRSALGGPARSAAAHDLP
jgi:ADP-ribose pyrophosphatase YjhB (NUDIX family)